MGSGTWAVVAAIGLALAGCGGSGSTAGKSSSAPPAAAPRSAPAGGASFAQKADSLCAATGAKVTQSPPLTASNFLSEIGQQRLLISKLVSDLRTLRPPARERRGFAAFLSSTQAQVGTLDATLKALAATHVKQAQALVGRLGAEGKASDRQAAALGLKDCAKDYSPGASPTAKST